MFHSYRPPGIPVSGIFGNISLEKFPRDFLGILLRPACNFYIGLLISSFDECSYSASFRFIIFCHVLCVVLVGLRSLLLY